MATVIIDLVESSSLPSDVESLLPTPGDVDFYEEHGYWVSGKVLPERLVDAAMAGAERHWRGERDWPLPTSGRFSDWKPGDGDTIRNSEYVSLQNREIRALVQYPVIGMMAARLSRSSIVRLWDDQLVSKPPVAGPTGPVVGWHSDRAYWMTCTSPEMLTAWIPLHDCPLEMGPVMYIDGSHRWPISESMRHFNLADLEGVQARTMRRDVDSLKRSITAEKGQVSFHHSRLIHASDVNRGTRPRTAIALHMQDERNRYRVYLNEKGDPWRLPNDAFCRKDAEGLPDYTDPTVFPVLYGPGAGVVDDRGASVMVTVVPASDGRWDAVLAPVPHDVFQTAGFHRFASTIEQGEPWLAVVGDSERGVAWPYLLRDLSGVEGLGATDARDIGSLYGYTGPVSWGVSAGDPWLATAWRQIRAVWLDQGAVSAFVRFHPLLPGGDLAAGLGELETGTISAWGTTVSIDCSVDDATAMGHYARVTRQEVEQARRAGLVTTPDDEWRHAATFVGLHEATLSRNDAAHEARLRLDELLRLRDELRGNLHLLITRSGEDIVAAGLFTEYRGIIQALLVGTDDRYRRHSPLKLLLDDVRRWGKARGDLVLHLGGGRGGSEDSLFAFKSRFSRRRHAFRTGRWILDRVAYQELVAARERWLAKAGRSTASPGWFPAFRAPLQALERVAIPVDGRPRPAARVAIAVRGTDRRLGGMPIRLDGAITQAPPG